MIKMCWEFYAACGLFCKGHKRDIELEANFFVDLYLVAKLWIKFHSCGRFLYLLEWIRETTSLPLNWMISPPLHGCTGCIAPCHHLPRHTLPISLEPPLWARLPDTRSAPLTSAQATAPSISSVDHETNHIFRHLEYGNLVNPKWIPPGSGTILPGFMGASRRLLYTTLKVSILEPVAAQEKLSVFAEISGNLHDFR